MAITTDTTRHRLLKKMVIGKKISGINKNIANMGEWRKIEPIESFRDKKVTAYGVGGTIQHFDSQTQCAKALGLTTANINGSYIGKNKHCRGYVITKQCNDYIRNALFMEYLKHKEDFVDVTRNACLTFEAGADCILDILREFGMYEDIQDIFKVLIERNNLK